MKTMHLKTKWLIPLLGFAVAAGGFKAATTYLGLQREAQSAEAFSATLDRIHVDEKISRALKELRDGDVSVAAQRLDQLLCEHIVLANAKLASVSDRQRAYEQYAFVRIAGLRPRNAEIAANATQELSNDQITAERILEDAQAAAISPSDGLAASH